MKVNCEVEVRDTIRIGDRFDSDDTIEVQVHLTGFCSAEYLYLSPYSAQVIIDHLTETLAELKAREQ